MSTLNGHWLPHIVMRFVFRNLHSDDWQPDVTTVSLCLWSHVHAEWTLASTHRHEVCVQKFTQWWLTTWCNHCVCGLMSTLNGHWLPRIIIGLDVLLKYYISLLLVSSPHWMNTPSLITVSMGLCSQLVQIEQTSTSIIGFVFTSLHWMAIDKLM